MKTGLWLGSLVSLAFVVLLGLSGCKTEPFCVPLGNCGGDFILGTDKDFRKNDGLLDHEWTIKGQDIFGNEFPKSISPVCQDQLEVPPVPLSLLRQPPVQATDRPPDKVTADWCYNLVLKSSGEVDRFIVWAPPTPLKVGQLVMSEDYDHARNRGTYSMQITYAQTRHLEFSETCLTAQGIRPTCPELGRHLGAFVAVEANIYSVRCFDPGEGKGGCNCDYELTFIGGPNGRWFAGGVAGEVTFFDDLFNPAVKTDYCVGGDPATGKTTLQLTGHDDQALFNAKSFRTMELSPPSCDDGVRNASTGEEGVDCGGPCAQGCGTCTDGVRNANEEGVDCGGVCLGILCDPDTSLGADVRKAACANGKQEKWEEGVDCGGPCRKLCGT
jgi:hypothetical protein